MVSGVKITRTSGLTGQALRTSANNVRRGIASELKYYSKKIADQARRNLEGIQELPAISLNGRAGTVRQAIDTGTLAESIQHAEHTSGDTYQAIIWTDVPYAWYIHEGFKSYPPNPFLSSAFAQEITNLLVYLKGKTPIEFEWI